MWIISWLCRYVFLVHFFNSLWYVLDFKVDVFFLQVTALLFVVTIPSRKLAILSWGKQNHALQSQTAGVLAQRDKSNVDQPLDMPVCFSPRNLSCDQYFPYQLLLAILAILIVTGYCASMCCEDYIEETCYSIFTGQVESCALIANGGCPCPIGQVKCGASLGYAGEILKQMTGINSETLEYHFM